VGSRWARWGAVTAAAVAVLLICGVAAGAASAETWTVDTTEDPSDANCSVPGKCSLREALKEASESESGNPQLVDATQVSGEIEIGDRGALRLTSEGGAPSISVEGPGPGQLVVNGGDESQIFRVAQSTYVEASLSISGMALVSGHAGQITDGGAIEIGHPEEGITGEQPLTVEDVDFIHNEAPDGSGGAIYEGPGAPLTLVGCVFEENQAKDGAGAIASNSQMLLRDTQVGTAIAGNSTTGSGGGIFVGPNASLTMDQGSTVYNNTASEHGGGIYAKDDAPVTMFGGEVSRNVSHGEGGGIFAEGGNIAVTDDSHVDSNSAASLGGGIHSEGGILSILGSSVEENETQEGSGGGIFATGSSGPASVRVEEGSQVDDNQAQGFDGAGGGIYAGPDTALTLAESTVQGNSASTSGGGIYVEGTSTKVSASTISANLAKGAVASATGGGIDVTSGDLSLINSTVAENVIEGAGSHGGGIGFDAGTSNGGALIANSTIARNSASAGTVGGLLAATISEIGSTIIAENTASGGCPDAGGGGLDSAGWNIVGDDSCGFSAGEGDQLGVSPGLGPLQSNGGPTETMAPAAASSPAINHGSNNAASLTTDQRGETRPVPAGDQSIDVGAYEVQAPFNTAAPSISGSPTVGQTLTCETGAWNTDHVTPTYSYAWSADGTPVGTGASYTVALTDEGDQLVCRVSADDGAESASAASAPLTVPAARLAVSPASIDFGSQQSGTESAPLTITVSNLGGNPLALGEVVLGGSGAGAFSLSDGCSGTLVAAGGDCQVGVRFAPSVDGGYAATLEIPSPVGGAQVDLRGIGHTPIGAISVTPAALDFGTQQTGTTGPPTTITIADSGDAALTVGPLALEGTGVAAYTLVADGCSGTTLEPGHHCEAKVRFAPAEDGSFAASLVVPNSAENQRIELGGIGRTPVGALSISPSSLDFGTLRTATTSAPRMVTVANTGDAALTLGELGLGGPDADQFSLAAGCSGKTLVPGESCAVAVTFAPNAAGELSAALQIPSSVGLRTVPLAGVGQPPSPPPSDGSPPPATGVGAGPGPPTTVGESADLRIHLSASRRSIAGGRLTAELEIVNRGPDAARSIEVTTSFDGVRLGAVDVRGSRCHGGHKIECAIPSLAPGRRVKLEITAIARRPGTLTVAAATRGVTADGSTSSDRDRVTVKVAPARRGQPHS
jgi:CSLREA domain-containing protein